MLLATSFAGAIFDNIVIMLCIYIFIFTLFKNIANMKNTPRFKYKFYVYCENSQNKKY